MDKFYHFTSFNNFNSIMNYGLIPASGARSFSIGDDKNAVFLSKSIGYSIKMYAFMKGLFDKNFGENGLRDIDSLNKEIEWLRKHNISNCEDRINEIQGIINRINFILI